MPLIIHRGKNTWRITGKNMEVLLVSNHEEVNTRLVFHAKMNNKAAAIVTKDAEVFYVNWNVFPDMAYED